MQNHNIGDKDFAKEFEAWNPMENAFVNAEFNTYSSGPGANLDPKLQPSELAKKKLDQKNRDSADPTPYLVFKNVPKEMSTKALYNLCKSHGNVKAVRDSAKNPHYFVDLYSIADMEAVYRALEHSNYGFTVYIGRELKEKQEDKEISSYTQPLPSAPKNESAINLEHRKYMTSSKQHPRPHVQQKAIISYSDYNSSTNLLQQNDPERHFLIDSDAHGLERAGLEDFNAELNLSSNYKYRSGRAYIEMPPYIETLISDKNRQSVGKFGTATETYTNDVMSGKPQTDCYPCSQCTRLCDTVCARCSQYFCNVECQRKAWPKHRYECGKPGQHKKNQSTTTTNKTSLAKDENKSPESKNTNLLSASATIASEFKESNMNSSTTSQLSTQIPQSGNLVSISAVSKSNVVFIRSKAYDDNLLFFKINSAIQSDSKNLKPLRTLPKCGQIVVAQFNGIYSRAMILNIDDLNKIKLILIDYGSLDVKLFDELLVAPPYYSDLPRLAVPVILKNVPDVFMTDNIRRFMYSHLDSIDMKLKYNQQDFNKERGVFEVELINSLTNENFNNAIITLWKPVEPRLGDTDNVVNYSYLKHKLLPIGNNVELIVMDNSLLSAGCISCTIAEYALEIQKFQLDLQTYANSIPETNYAPRIGELCIAKYSVDQKWYRAHCLDLVGDGYPTLVFFDYGNISMVSVNDIRRYPLQFTFPIYTSDCEIKGLPECCENNLVERLEQLIPNGSKLKCDSVTVYEGDTIHIIEVNRIINQLENEGLLGRVGIKG